MPPRCRDLPVETSNISSSYPFASVCSFLMNMQSLGMQKTTNLTYLCPKFLGSWRKLPRACELFVSVSLRVFWSPTSSELRPGICPPLRRWSTPGYMESTVKGIASDPGWACFRDRGEITCESVLIRIGSHILRCGRVYPMVLAGCILSTPVYWLIGMLYVTLTLHLPLPLPPPLFASSAHLDLIACCPRDSSGPSILGVEMTDAGSGRVKCRMGARSSGATSPVI
jgi:hypothetical protein